MKLNRGKKNTWMSWSTGKDSAFALYQLTTRTDIQVTGLLTTVTEDYNRVSMHAVREELLELQAESLGLPLYKVKIPSKCTNEIYESRMREAINEAIKCGVSHMAFGDLFLEDIRKYREDKLKGTGIEPLFPLWNYPTKILANEMMKSGLKAVITCIDPKVLPESFAGREYDENLLADLPAHVDPLGENGEFHTFAYDGPMFRKPIRIQVGERILRDGFIFTDVYSI